MLDNIEVDIRKLIADILECNPYEIDENALFVKDLGMDSMMALEILAGIEKIYRIVIPEDRLTEFTSLKETIRIVKDILNKK